MEDVGFGAGEGLDFLDDFGLGEMQEVTGVDDLIEKAAPLDDLDDTLTREKSVTGDETDELEQKDKAVSDAVAELTNGDLSSIVDFEREAKDATVPEQPTGTCDQCYFKERSCLYYYAQLSNFYHLFTFFHSLLPSSRPIFIFCLSKV